MILLAVFKANLPSSGNAPSSNWRERGDGRRHLIQCGLVGMLHVTGRRSFYVKKRRHRAMLHVGARTAAGLGQRQSGVRKLWSDCSFGGMRFNPNRSGPPHRRDHERDTLRPGPHALRRASGLQDRFAVSGPSDITDPIYIGRSWCSVYRTLTTR
jgi:hypothetical protein